MSERKDGSTTKPAEKGAEFGGNFVREIIAEDIAAKKNDGRVATRFPPEPNGYLHIGHAKAICVDFGLAKEFGGTCNLRFDDTNPTTEDVEYVDSIQADIRWLGFTWDNLHYASDYFEDLYNLAEKLIQKDLAYVDSLDEEQIREYRGNFYKKGIDSPFRNRPIAESLDLFRRMRAGEFDEGAHVLRAKIDLQSQNMNMRDPLLYRIRKAPHHRTGTKWCIYPLYDFAHPLSDAVEKITHSICTVEFESHRPLYDWCIRETEVFPSRQIEFARLNLTYTVMSKRKLLELVQKKVVNGWDDPRMPTLAGLRRRGYTAEAIRTFCDRVGVSKADSIVDVGLLEHYLREDLNKRTVRVMAVVHPLKLVIENFPEGEVRELEAPLSPEDPSMGSRKLPFSRTLYIDHDDFREDTPKGWFRLAPGAEVRLRYACLLTCKDVIKNDKGEVVELRCTMDPASWGGTAPDGRTVKGTLHWVSAEQSVPIEVRLYDRLFRVENPGGTEGVSSLDELNPDALVTRQGRAEPHVGRAKPGDRVQFERVGYFCADPDSTAERTVWNRTVTLRDTWAKLEAKLDKPAAGQGKPGKPGKPAKPAAANAETNATTKADANANAPRAQGEGATAAKAAPKPATPKGGPAAEVGIDDFSKLDLRIGVVKTASLVEGADKLVRVEVDLGEGRLRQIFSGIRASYPEPETLVGKRVVVIANLKPRQMKFGLSEGMILAATTEGGHARVIVPESDGGPGDRVS